jgi:hypothetical protein
MSHLFTTIFNFLLNYVLFFSQQRAGLSCSTSPLSFYIDILKIFLYLQIFLVVLLKKSQHAGIPYRFHPYLFYVQTLQHFCIYK